MSATEGPFGYLDTSIWQYDGQHKWWKTLHQILMEKKFWLSMNTGLHE